MFATAFGQNHHKCFLFREPSALDIQYTLTFPLKPCNRHFPGIPSRTPGGRHQGALPRPAPELPRRQRAGMVSDGGPGPNRGPGPGTVEPGVSRAPAPGAVEGRLPGGLRIPSSQPQGSGRLRCAPGLCRGSNALALRGKRAGVA